MALPFISNVSCEMIVSNLTQLSAFSSYQKVRFERLLGHSVLSLKRLNSAGVPTYEYGMGLHGSNNQGRRYPASDMQTEVYKLIIFEIYINNI
jgi:hypothetical protein